ncbi:DIVERGENT CRAL/TRIO DOMAIN PROTEIN [Salix viminalis]|uniref:DIVERGENT CRAL/TRIO DOMAIN PROTEIN n=1 Tax=Salix viminalis TaxID=40686 RepID=A0A9Q0NZ51_SALVM|nr:DIVERGENT CRAL/TRIO DOMAIN PROTEIN [Salix viminalis]
MYLIRRQPQTQQENGPSEREAKVCELRAALGPLSGRSLQFCTDSCLRRYLEARSWNHEVAHEGVTGKISRANFHDRYGRTVLIMRPGMQTTKCTEDNVRYMVYLLENGILNLADGQEQMSWLIDFTGWSLSTNIPIKTSRDCINVLQNHYPQRLAIAFLYNPPRIFEAFWKAVRYFMDPITSQKVKFVYPKKKESLELMQSYFDIENLPSEFGGKASLEYDHEEFSRSMVEDDVRTAKFWGSVEKSRHVADDHLAQVAPPPAPPPLAITAS